MSSTATDAALERLLRSEEPAVRHLAGVRLAGGSDVDVTSSPLVRALSRDHGLHPYAKWRGAFWRLVALVELGVPEGHPGARRAAEAALAWLDAPSHRKRPVLEGRVRRCASQEGNGLAAAVALGLAGDARVERLVETLLASQWPDGGWNCDRRPEASHSSFHESWAPIRGLAAYARETGDAAADAAAGRGAEFLLRHRVHCAERSGLPHEHLMRLRWPPYWHYDALVGVTTLARSVGLGDERVRPALELIASKRRADGTWRTEGRWWKPPGAKGSGVEAVDWGPAADELLTIACLSVLWPAT